MEGLSTHVYKGIKKYWNRRGYVRLSNNERKNRTRIKLGQEQPDPNKSQGKRKRFWRFKISPRVRIWARVGSPKKWLTRLRDAYVNMMLKISGSGFVSGASGFGGSIEYGFSKGQVKEYDEKMIVEIYRSLVIAQGQLVPRVGNSNNINNNNKINGSQNRISISTR
ncbi:uncharacterized protein LOC141603162 [Silene latifolia]|uniref:uncharacterized protein LOC141603162 n=1 Tax=Silene latifolia TaxID=37657 RepID=UPI003D77248A